MNNRLTKKEPCLGGFIIRAIKKVRGVTVDDMQHIGFAKRTICNWTDGSCRPSFDDVNLICEHYNIDISTAKLMALNLKAEYRCKREAKRRKNKSQNLG